MCSGERKLPGAIGLLPIKTVDDTMFPNHARVTFNKIENYDLMK